MKTRRENKKTKILTIKNFKTMKTVENKKGVQALNEEELNQVTGGVVKGINPLIEANK